MKKKDKEGFDEENLYEDKARESLVEDDEISSEEEAFMSGYEKAESSEEVSEEEE